MGNTPELEQSIKTIEQNELEQKHREKEILRLGGILAFEDFTVEKFENKKILAAMINYPNDNYFLYGPSGTGKTHAAVAILRKIPNAYVLRMPRISRWLRRAQTPDEEIATIKLISNLNILIDDLGCEKMTDFLQSNLFEIIDRRVQYKKNGLIITSNYNLDQLSSIIGDRIVSRIIGLVGRKNVIKFSGKDFRWEGK